MPRKTTRARTVISDSRLRKATDYLEYDLHTFVAGLEIYLQRRGSEIGNVALDSFLLRSRLLMDFLMNDSAQDDDVIALDFFHDYNPKPYKPRMTESLQREKKKINKRLMHLTTVPMPILRSNQRYSPINIVPPIITAFRKWLTVVPDRRLQRPASETRRIFKEHLQRVERLNVLPDAGLIDCAKIDGFENSSKEMRPRFSNPLSPTT